MLKNLARVNHSSFVVIVPAGPSARCFVHMHVIFQVHVDAIMMQEIQVYIKSYLNPSGFSLPIFSISGLLKV